MHGLPLANASSSPVGGHTAGEAADVPCLPQLVHRSHRTLTAHGACQAIKRAFVPGPQAEGEGIAGEMQGGPCTAEGEGFAGEVQGGPGTAEGRGGMQRKCSARLNWSVTASH